MALFELNPTTKIGYNLIPHLVPKNTFFIHGNLASNRWWMPTIELLQAQSQGQSLIGSVICAEFRGCGDSTAPASESEVTIQNFANDFIALIRSLKLTKVNLVGHSTGGTIAAAMLATAPELFEKAYLLDPVGAEGVKFNEVMIAAFEAMKNDKNLTATVIGSTIQNNNADSAFFKDIVVEDAFKSVKAVGHLVLKALDGLDIRESLKKVTVPVKVVHGELDQLLPVEESKKMAQLFQQGQFEILAGCGHCGNIENTKFFVDSMSQFLYK